MTNYTLPVRDVAFLAALAEFLLASGSDRAADAVLSAIRLRRRTDSETQAAINALNKRL